MTNDNRRSSTRMVSLLVATALLVSGCGGGGGGDSDSGTACDAMGFAAILTAGLCAFIPASAVTTSSGTSSTGTSAPPPAPIPGPAAGRIVPNYDIEPNDVLPNATVVSMMSHDGFIGFETRGNAHGIFDLTDTYALTVDRRWGIEVRLCAGDDPDCRRGPIPSSALYVEVVDTLGNVIGSSPVDGQFLKVAIDGGLVYYVRVIANPWTSTMQSYYLRTALIDPALVPATDAPIEPGAEGTDPAPAVEVPSAPTLWISDSLNQTVTLDWQPPTDYTDGTPLTSISEYVLYVGDIAGGPYQYSHHLSTGLSSFMLTLPDWGIWHITLAAVDGNGIEGELSVELSAGGPPPDMP